jgi:hypothetical protein
MLILFVSLVIVITVVRVVGQNLEFIRQENRQDGRADYEETGMTSQESHGGMRRTG